MTDPTEKGSKNYNCILASTESMQETLVKKQNHTESWQEATVKLQWLGHLWNQESMFKTGGV